MCREGVSYLPVVFCTFGSRFVGDNPLPLGACELSYRIFLWEGGEGGGWGGGGGGVGGNVDACEGHTRALYILINFWAYLRCIPIL